VRVPFRDLRVIDADERFQLRRIFEGFLDDGQLIDGESTRALENEFSRSVKRNHCVSVANGTAALHLAMLALGIGPGHRVMTTPLSWVSTATAVLATGAELVFTDVDEHGNLSCEGIRANLDQHISAVVAVDYFGRLADLIELEEVCQDGGVFLVEDAAQAAGAVLSDRPAGSFGDVSTFSFNPMKTLAALGEAGALVFDDTSLLRTAVLARHLGLDGVEGSIFPSLNHRSDALQTRILSYRLATLSKRVARRQRTAERYTSQLSGCVQTPDMSDIRRSAFFDYTIRCDARDQLETHLLNRGIEVRVRYRRLLPDHPGIAGDQVDGLVTARRISTTSLSLPIFEGITDDQIDYVVEHLQSFFGS